LRCQLLADPDPESHSGSLRHPAVTAAVLIAIGYGLLAFVLPHPSPTFDEAKYLAIGLNALHGLGPRTAFGGLFLPHSPLWPMVFAAPASALGVAPWAWGYLLNAVSATGVLLLTAWLARPFGPRAMLLAIAALVGWLTLLGLARTARLDVPEAALALAYVAVAASAVETGLVRRGILAGALFAWAFLVKEASLVLLAAPFLVAIAQRRPLASTARTAGLVLVVAVPMVSWWFGWFASTTDKVYALGLGGGFALPLGVGLILLGVGLVAAGGGSGLATRLRAPLETRLAGRRAAIGVACLVLLIWIVAFLLAFSRSEVQAGRPLLDIGNIVRWARVWAVDLAPILLIAVGAVGGVVMALRGDDRPLAPLIVVAAGFPWVLLVAVLGEPPRNDIALIAVLAVAGAAGWLELPRILAGRPGLMTVVGAVVGAGVGLVADLQLAHHGVLTGVTRHTQGVVVSVVLGAVAGGAGSSALGREWLLRRLGGASRGTTSPVLLRGVAVAAVAAVAVGVVGVATPKLATASAVSNTSGLAAKVADWVDQNVPAGSTIMFGSVLANETALRLSGTYQLRSLQAKIGVTDPSAPLGITVKGVKAPDIVAVDRHPRQDGFLAFTAADVAGSLRLHRPVAWVYVTGLDTATPSMVPWLETVPGITLATRLDSPAGVGQPLVAHIFRVDMTSLAVPTDRTFASPAAVNALLDGLSPSPEGPAIARTLLPRLSMSETGAAADAAMARLRAMGAG
jgi:hypothetical protein